MSTMEELPLLSDDDLARLTQEELDTYLALLEADAKVWRLTPRQQLADDLADQVDELMFGGAAGGGKSEFDIYHANKWSVKIPNHRTLILRSSFPELRRTLIVRSLQKLLPHVTASGPQNEPARYRVGDKEWHYANGSVIEFGFCETFDDTRQYLSAEYELLIIDESTDFTWEQIELLRSRLRTSKKKRAMGCRPHMILSTNPGGTGHAEHKKRYVTSTMGGKKIATVLDNPNDPQSARTVAFVPSKVSDNPHMDPDYERNLRSLRDPVKRAQYLDGSWDVFEGQFFAEYDRTVHEIAPFEIPRAWPRVRAIDFGTAAPFCCLWAAFDQDGNAYIYRELYGPGLTATEQAKLIVQHTGTEKIEFTVADPSIWARTGTGTSIAQVYRDAGVACRKAMNARVDGWNRVREYLRGTNDPKDMHFGSYVRIVAAHCPNLVRTLPDLQRDRNRQDDLDTTAEDHAADALRYLLMSKPRKAKRPPEERYSGEQRAWDDIEDIIKSRSEQNHPVLGKNV